MSSALRPPPQPGASVSSRVISARVVSILALACLAPAWARAQESIRPSGTGAAAAAARQQENDTQHPYNIKAGPVSVNVTGSLSIEANDNINLAEKGRESDLILRPEIDFDSEWRVTELNTLHLKLGLGYNEYLSHSDLNTRTILLDPGSELSFDVYVGDILKLNFHDQFAIVQNPVDEPTLSNVARFDRFQNSSGITALMDFNALQFVFGYDHFLYNTLGSEFSTLDRTEEQFFGSASVALSDALNVGIEGSTALVNYRENFNNDGTTWTAGPFAEITFSPYSKLRLNGGYQGMQFNANGTSGDTSNASGWYVNLTAAQRLNQYWSHSLSVGREARLGLDVNFTEYTYVRYEATWRMNSRLSVGFNGFYEDAEESGTSALNSETSHRWGGGASLTWQLDRKTSVQLRYQYVNKDSNLDLRGYYQNTADLLLNYNF